MKAKFLYLILIILLSASCGLRDNAEIVIALNDNWQFKCADSTVWRSVTVPGNVYSDLISNDIIDKDTNVESVSVQLQDKVWEYTTEFNIKERILKKDNIELEFLGLDTYADVYLNDSLIIVADNMFRKWDCNIKDIVKQGKNRLRVVFKPVVKEGLKHLKASPYIMQASNERAPEHLKTSPYTRKAQFSYGWDWAPRFLTSGIWRGVNIRAWSKGRINNHYFRLDSLSSDKAMYSVDVDVEISTPGKYYVVATFDSDVMETFAKRNLNVGMNRVTIPVTIHNPKLWWPNGYGDQYLYNTKVYLVKEARAISKSEGQFGVRKIKLHRDKDSIGESFRFSVNGEDIFIKGANYVPPVASKYGVNTDEATNLLKLTTDANMNMLRVWGGAIYENDEFYRECDRRGVLIWQDFMFACNTSPSDSAFLNNVKVEAEYNVKRLRNHPSVALWCGNNENLMAWNNWGWKRKYTATQQQEIEDNYREIFHKILPDAVKKHQPDTYYHSSSPSTYSGEITDVDNGDNHAWDIWFGERDIDIYNSEPTPRFTSEFGMQSLPSFYTLRKFAGDDVLNKGWESSHIRSRQRCIMPWLGKGNSYSGNEMMQDYVLRSYAKPNSFIEWIYLTQMVQAEAYKNVIEKHRLNRQRSYGVLYWQLNDTWPSISWSTTESDLKKKASHYVVSKAFEPLITVVSRQDSVNKLYVINDKLDSVDLTVKLSVINLRGECIESNEYSVLARANDNTYIADISNLAISDSVLCREHMVVAESYTKSGEPVYIGTYYFDKVKNLKLLDNKINYDIELRRGVLTVRLKSDVVHKDVVVELLGNRGDFTDNCFDLLPDKEVVVSTKTSFKNESEVLKSLRIFSANRYIENKL
ncbi:MAG: hypothetical protein N4A72_15610 [Bacteroidales bacterium]|jgi:beta-mannosidase|nr:hypothetical protein [Bacteroidales bacterium]